MAPVGVALVGGGIFIKTEHLPAVLKSDSLSLKAIFSRSLKSAQETADLAPSGTDVDLYSNNSGVGNTYHDLLLREDIAAVIIALPINAQPEYIEAALAAGKHVLAEKPIAPSVSGAQKLIDFVAKTTADNGATLGVAENFRFRPDFAYAQEQAGKLGKVKQFSILALLGMPKDSAYYNTYWRTKPEFQGGFVLDAGIHFAAAARLFLRGGVAPETLHAFTGQISEHLIPIDTAHAIIKLRSGASGSFQISMGSTFGSTIEYRIELEHGTVYMINSKVIVRRNGEFEKVQEFAPSSGVAEEVEAWAEGLVKGMPNARQSPHLALGDLELMEAIFMSADQNGQGQMLSLQ